ncbi:MAG TPA: hypothetical protein VN826_10990 [Candidatus Eisenbacteria bacterium]|nr:hypothetical protein [Candidatus Eisenbacteria bacterium]
MALPRLWAPMLAAVAFGALAIFLPALSLAQSSEIEQLRSVVDGLQQQLQKALQRIDQLEKERTATSDKVNELEQEKTTTSGRIGQVEKSVQAVQSASSALNPAIGMVLDANVSQRSKAGGNFNFRSAEIGLAASVDPFARMYGFINGTSDGVEVDEAAAVTTSLPWNLTAKGGRFLADFGRFPKVHEHELPFVNQPLSIERMIGGETRADGAELNYLFPTPFFLRATLGGYNEIGEENQQVDNRKSRSWSRFTYLGRLNTYFDLSDNHSIELGTSMAYTPSVRLTGSADGGDRMLNGIDLTYRFQPLASTVYQGVTVGSEIFRNSEQFAFESVAKRREAFGGYSYAELKLSKNWSTGFLFDYAPSVSSPGKKTIGYSPFVTWNMSEFNRLRFQFTHADDRVREDKNDGGNQVFLQWTTVIGAHTHGFLGR